MKVISDNVLFSISFIIEELLLKLATFFYTYILTWCFLTICNEKCVLMFCITDDPIEGGKEKNGRSGHILNI